jgi:CubicO group peptidase (beta-lactamase class C family)
MFSLSKSFTATAIGLLEAEGQLRLDAPVLSFFPEEDNAVAQENMRSMQVRHLLMMGTGHVTDTSPRLPELGGDNWVHGFFQCAVEREPGSYFLYNNGATYMLSAIVQRVSGQTLLEYLTPRLFNPLGIEQPTWEMSPQGICLGNSGLKIRTEDIAAFGQLYLDRGRFNGKALLPEAWVDEATRAHIANGTDPSSDWAQGYGYQFWRSRHGAYRGDGAFGQFCFVMPDQDAVLAMTSGLSDMRPVFDAVWEELLPGLMDGPAAPSSADDTRLTEALQALRLSDLATQSSLSSPPGSRAPRQMVFAPSQEHAGSTVSLEFLDPDQVNVRLHHQGREILVRCGFAEAVDDQSIPLLLKGQPEPVSAKALWQNPNTLELALRFYETPFCQHVRMIFHDREVALEIWRNTNPGEIQTLTGTLVD